VTEKLFLHLEIPGTPIAKGRPRIAKNGHVYTPSKTRGYEDVIRLATRVAMAGRPPTENPCRVHVTALFQPPGSWSKKKKKEIRVHATKPDLDNVVKSALDGICFATGAIRDDKQINEIRATKSYAQDASLMIEVFEMVGTTREG
jgi:Holliday junction resolvase RusA-like endonuclease